jgi:hypothetical protein
MGGDDEVANQKKKFGEYGYSKLQVRDVGALYASVTGKKIEDWDHWKEFDESIKRRNAIVHDGKDATRNDAQQTIDTALRFILHIKEARPISKDA